MKNHNSILLAGILAGILMVPSKTLAGEPLGIWISSYQDKVYYQDMVELYREKVDDQFQANIQAFGFREMPDKFAVAIKTGKNAPDIVQLDEVLFGTYLSGEVPFVDLTDRVKKAGLDQKILAQRLTLFGEDKRIYGLPQSLSAMMLYYRTDLFEEHNITPRDLRTWDDFVRVGEHLAEDNQALIALDPTYFGILLRQQGTDLFGPTGTLFPDAATALHTLNWLRSLQDKGIGVMPERASIYDPVFFSNAVSYGQILCIIGADWYGLDMIQQFTPDLKGKWGVMPLPAWRQPDGSLSPRTSTFAGQGLLIYKDSPRIEQAWRFIEFVMTDTEANVRRFVNGNSFPAYKPVWREDALLQPMPFFSGQSMGQLLIQLAPEMPEVVTHPKRPQAVFLFQESLFSAFMYKQLSAEETLEQMKSQLGMR